MSERLPWFRCVPSALLGALAGMRPDEGYVYVVLLMRIYETGGPVAETDRTLSRRTGLPERKVAAALQFLIDIAKVYRLPDGRLDSASTHDEIEWQIARRADQSKAGKASKSKKNVSFLKTNGSGDGEKPQQNQQNEATSVQQASNHKDIDIEVNTVAKATGVAAVSDPVPVDQTKAVRDRLWLDGPTALVAMGQREGMARSMIGRWLKMTGDDPGRVHAAIEEAQRAGTGDPIPYINRVLSDRTQPGRGPPRNGNPTNADLMQHFADELRAKHEPSSDRTEESGAGHGFGRGPGAGAPLFERPRLEREFSGPTLDLVAGRAVDR